MISPRRSRVSRSILAILLSLVFAFAAMGSLPGTRWTWMDGPSAGNQPGVYGTLGISAPANTPGARRGAATWKDLQGNLWLFGGTGLDKNGTFGHLNDLWKYDVATGEWTWMKGSDLTDAYGIYGSLGATSDVFRPGARYRSVCWTDAQGRFWLFGGDGWAVSGGSAGLNDLWMYDPNPGSIHSGRWTWMHGTNQRYHDGVLGTQGVANNSNKPPNLHAAVGWADAAGHLWLFGGLYGSGPSPTFLAERNDLWKFDIENRRWTWMKGTGIGNAAGVYGTQGNGTTSTRPGGRFVAQSWADPQGRLWLFGGYGHGTSALSDGSLQDLWRYDPATNIWTWMKGTSALNQHAHHNTRGVAAHSTLPGGTTEGVTWTDAQGDLWLYGGAGYANEGDSGELSALWRYQGGPNQWTWMNGSDATAEAPVFGTPGSYDPLNANTPGGLHGSAAWVATPHRLWFFGGVDYYAPLGDTHYNTLWQLAALHSITVTGPDGPLGGNNSVDFGTTTIGTDVTRTFTILNTGLTTLSGLNVAVQAIHGGTFVVTTPPSATLAPGASTTFIVTLTPGATGFADATLMIDDTGDLSPFAIGATGTGTLPEVTVAVTPDWAWEDAGTPLVFTFTRNGSTANPLTVDFGVSGTAALASDYTATGADSFTASAGTIIIPAGSATAAVTITSASDTTPEIEEGVQFNVVPTAVYNDAFPNAAAIAIASEELLPGGRDRTFFPEIIGNGVVAAAVQPDGKVLIGGGFTSVNGVAQSNLARLHPDGTLDAAFAPAVPFYANGILVQPDGGIVLAGGATGLARLLAGGSPDPAFTVPPTFLAINALAQQADGKLLIGGDFTINSGGETWTRIARLHPDGTLDTTFNPGLGADAWVECIAVQPDGRIIVGGQFTTFGGQSRNGIARLDANGTLDPSFNPGTGASGGLGSVLTLALQPNGRIVIGGIFTAFNGQSRLNIARLESTGSLDLTFHPAAAADDTIYTLALQADGKILLGGYFANVNGQPSPSLARLHADGTFDATFQIAYGPSNGVLGLTLLADGQVLSYGNVSFIEEAHSLIARRANTPATQTLRPFSGGVVNWLRGGAAPELSSVLFELSTDGGANWTPLGVGERTAGGWRSIVSPLPISGQLRARGTATGGFFGSSASLHEHIAPFTRAPEIVVEGPGSYIVAGAGGPGPFGNPTLINGPGKVDFGLRQHPAPLFEPGGGYLMFTVHNVGNDDFPGLEVNIDGDHAADFSYALGYTLPGGTSAIPPGGWRSVAVRLSPRTLGERRATLHLTTTDADESPFDIALTGFGATRREIWRHTHFGTLAGTGPAADDADPDADGNDNNLEYLASLDPNDPGSRFALRIEAVEGEPTQRRLLFTALAPPFGTPTPTVTLQYRTSLTEGDWEILPTIIQTSLFEWFTVDTDAGGPAKFYRVVITPPPAG